jgi:protein Mpv17
MVQLHSHSSTTANSSRFLWLGDHFNYPSKALSILVKVCVQQAVFTPIFNSYFFGMQAALTGESPSGVIERIKATVPISIVNSLKLWPAVTAFSFAFIPTEYRFMFGGVFAVAWQGYLSFLNRKEEKVERVGLNTVRALVKLDEQLEEVAKQKVEVVKEKVQEVKNKVEDVSSSR